MELCSLRLGLWVLLSGALEGVIVLRISLVCFFPRYTDCSSLPDL